MSQFLKYGLIWDQGKDALDVELTMIRQGGFVVGPDGRKYGEGLFQHYRNAQTLLWPEDDHHRWTDLILRSLTSNEITVLMGSSDSGKSYVIAKFVLVDWWAWPDVTLWLLSSTELRGAELRIWGSIKQLFNRARRVAPDLPGTVLESKHAISTEEISEDGSEARLLTKGLIFIPCKSNNSWVGMGAYAGIKPVRYGKIEGRLGHVGDEASVMEMSFLDAYANWYGKPNFRGVLTGNPYDLDDPLCTAGEPVDGWDLWRDTGKTQEWESKFYGAHVICLDGRDSPNFDYPTNERVHFPYLVGRKKLEATAKTHGEDSALFYNQCVGKPRAVGDIRRVITRQLCENHKAFESVIWEGSDLVSIGFLDAAYGGVGGDDCMCGSLQFGRDVAGRNVLAIRQLVLVPVSVNITIDEPEIQIAKFVKQYCEGFDIPPENFFFDGRGTLAINIARTWSNSVNVVDFGGVPTKRTVSQEEFIWDGDANTRRLKRCDEHYSKFVTELWFAVYYLIIGEQMRQLPREAASEGWRRTWDRVGGNRIEVETKADMKKRTGRSPDRMDAVVVGIEGARRRGFVIENMRDDRNKIEPDDDWLVREVEKLRKEMKPYELTYD